MSIATIEHLMAALFGTGVDNVLVDVQGEEVPILDGSCKTFVQEFVNVGLIHQDKRRKYMKITKPVTVSY
jgi:UDP-3-O-[3-hydroxymyristoyl] N-acetylglucosamine deacetylase